MTEHKNLQTALVHMAHAPKTEFEWGSTAWGVSKEACGSPDLTVGRVIIKAGRANGSHYHSNCDEVLYLLAGKLDHYADDIGCVRMEPGDAILIPAGVAHHAECLSDDDAEMIVVYSAGEREIASADPKG